VALVTVLALSASTGVASAATFAVTSTADSGPGSLRQAIVDANANTGADTISFALPGSDVQTITVTSGPLPAVTDPVVIDARTQPGYTDFPLVQLDNGGGKWTGLKIETGQSRVFGLEVTRFTVGIRLAGDGNTVAACFIGTDGGSTAGLGNTAGVRIESGSGNTVGGTTADMLNLISANGTGVDVVGVSAKKTKVAGNFVGTDRAGSAARPNTIGIRVSAGSTGNVVGGAGSAGARNLISGNTTGVDITGSTTTGNTVVGNFLGTNFGGGGGVPNGEGVLVEGGASGNTIGGFDTAARNVISGNSVAGVHIAGAGTTGNRVFRNLVGTDAGGSARLANRQGVVVSGGATGNTIGDATPGGRPVVSGNVEAGIEITGSGTSGNAVRGAYVGTNAAGNAALGNGTGVRIEAGASGNTVGGTAAGARNLISGNTNGTGVDLRGSGTTGNVVAGNYIGTDAAGGAALANTWGVRIEAGASGNTVGGSTAGARNLISGNGSNSRIDGAGVTINGAGTTGDTVAGNYIGTDAAGGAAVPNVFDDVRIEAGASGNTIGGTTAGARNVIAGSSTGVLIYGASANTVAGNYIGTNAAGTGALGNFNGVTVDTASGNTIGGTAAGARNLISGNTRGVIMFGATGTVVAGNYIGTDVTGAAALGSAGNGVVVGNGSTGNTIGGATAGAGNVISGSAHAGVSITDPGTNANVVAGNEIGTDAAGDAAIGNGVGVGIDRGASGNTVGGTGAAARNLISGNTGDGVEISSTYSSTTGNVVEGNYIGTNGAGNAALGNGVGVGIDRAAKANTIGGTTTGARNVISANAGAGVLLSDPGTSKNTVAGNYIGTTADGSAGLGDRSGLVIENGAAGTTIGGTAAGAGNVISGNAEDGVEINGKGTNGTFVAGNRIGTDAGGSGALGNAAGVLVEAGAKLTKIGGTKAGATNVISGNTGPAVEIDGPTATGTTVAANLIGTDAAGRGSLGNGAGVLIAGASGNTVGGTTADAGNTIAFNDGAGVTVDGTAAAANGDSILGNGIFFNGGLGISLLAGGNHGQAAPQITSVQTGGSTTTIGGTLHSASSTQFRLEFFQSKTCDPSGSGEGRIFVGSTNVTTDSGGDVSFFEDVPAIPSGRAVTATATDLSTGDTSQFSTCFTSP